MSDNANDAQLMALAAWHLRGLLDHSPYGQDRDNPPLAIRTASGGWLYLRQASKGEPAMVDDQTGIVTPIDPGDMKGSIFQALRAAGDRAVSHLIDRLHEVADAHAHVGRTRWGLVLYSRVGVRLCDWTAGLLGETGELVVRCEPVYGRYASRVRGWRASSGSGLDGWLRALANELKEQR